MGIRIFYIIGIVYGVASALGLFHKTLSGHILFVLLAVTTIYYGYYIFRRKIELSNTIIAACMVNVSVQLTGGLASPLFSAYPVILSIIGYKENHTNYWIIALSLFAAEVLSSLFSHAVVIIPLIIYGASVCVIGLIISKRLEIESFLKKSLMKYEARDKFFSPAEFSHKKIVTTVREIDQHPGIERPLLFFVKLIHQFLDAHTTAIFSYYNNYLTLIQGFSHSELFKPETVMVAETGIYRQIIASGKPVLIKEFTLNPEELGYYRGQVHISSIMIAPIMLLDTVEGLLIADRREGHFEEKDKDKFFEATKTAGFLLAMLKLYEEKSYEAKYLKFIAEHVKEFHKELELKKILTDAVQSFKAVMECNDVTIASIDELNNAGEILESTYVREHTKFALDDGLAGFIARHRNFIIKEDLGKSDIVVFKKGVKTKNQSFVGVPIQLDDELLGVIWLEDSREKKFNEDSARALNILASQLSFAWQRALHHEQQVELAARDGLTDLYSHRRFQEILEEEIQKNNEFVLLFFDIDHFKKINDTYGHQAGDEVLKFLGRLIAKTGIAARYGGEEFAIILPKHSLEKGLRVATRLKDHLLKSEIKFNQTVIRISISIGVAHFPTDAKTRIELIEQADKALYRGKQTGRNKIVVAHTMEERGSPS